MLRTERSSASAPPSGSSVGQLIGEILHRRDKVELLSLALTASSPIPSLKLTASSPLKMDGWNPIVSLNRPCLFSAAKMLVSGRVLFLLFYHFLFCQEFQPGQLAWIGAIGKTEYVAVATHRPGYSAYCVCVFSCFFTRIRQWGGQDAPAHFRKQLDGEAKSWQSFCCNLGILEA